MTTEPIIALAFRFHVNFYHSYRGDSLDDRGIGKDIRVIRGILDDLDRLNAEGVPARGVWDIENYYSLEELMPRHAPDIVERIKARVASGMDEVEPMSYNNGLIAAHDRDEARRAIAWAVSNPSRSGLADIFGVFAPIVRPQECMFTPSNIADYKDAGIEVLSVYYSAIPFNGFGSFIPAMPFAARYNPIRLSSRDEGATMTVLPAYNHGDVVEHGLSLRRWISSMRRKQLAEAAGDDLLLVLDLDADDYFWEGLHLPVVGRFLPAFSGLYALASSVADLPCLRFERPWDYVRAHPARFEVAFGQDCADGSWDGFSSWAEKRENYEVWSVIDRARRVAAAADLLVGDAPPAGFSEARSGAVTARVLALSTTHFGMASPAMNTRRLEGAFARAQDALDKGSALLGLAGAGGIPIGGAPLRFLDPELGELERGSGSLVHLDDGDDGAGLELCLLDEADEIGSRRCVVNPPGPVLREGARWDAPGPVFPGSDGSVSNGLLRIATMADGTLRLSSAAVGEPGCMLGAPAIGYGGRRLASRVRGSATIRLPGGGLAADLVETGEILFPAGEKAAWTRRCTLVSGLPYLYVDLEISYPETRHRGFDPGKAERLGRTWDASWRETMPCELLPGIGATEELPAKVWKHNFEDRVSSFDVDYHRFGPNRRITAINNQITDGWLAVAGPKGGFLVAQSASAQTSFAFCPLRTVATRGLQETRLNPFGTYFGPQLRYPTAGNGLGRLLSVRMGNQYDSYAPSWPGGSLRARFMLAPYKGDRPPAGLQRDALLFASLPVRVDPGAGEEGEAASVSQPVASSHPPRSLLA